MCWYRKRIHVISDGRLVLGDTVPYMRHAPAMLRTHGHVTQLHHDVHVTDTLLTLPAYARMCSLTLRDANTCVSRSIAYNFYCPIQRPFRISTFPQSLKGNRRFSLITLFVGTRSTSSYNIESSQYLLCKRIFLIDPSRMERDRNKMAESLLNLILEIIYQLTGEDYTVVKKTSSGHCQAPEYNGPIPGSPPHPLIQEEINGQKILELTNKMLELLTGEVPVRCHYVAVCFSMEEWEYLEGHKDLYKEVMIEDHQPLTSAGNRHDYIHMDFHYLYVQNEFSLCLCFLQVDPVRGQPRRDVPVLFFHRMIR
ncbi:uncharacterized protein RB166_000442 [Leptodactylus fuscus]